jgi:pimeloyl-ACP methyl ester carboxylesterase
MLRAETLQAEGSRYAAALLFVPGLWAGAQAWQSLAGYLAHRGWECHLLDARGIAQGLAGRAAAVAEYAAGLGSHAVVLGHDAGALVALATAARGAAAAVLVAPLVPGTRSVRALAFAPRTLAALLTGRPVPPPGGRPARLLAAGLPEAVREELARILGPDDVAVVREVLWGRARPLVAAPVPTLVVSGARDPLLPPPAAAALARALGAEQRVLAEAGHWPLAGPGWQRAGDLVHRWIVQRLGEGLLELYPEAMAGREAASDDGEE